MSRLKSSIGGLALAGILLVSGCSSKKINPNREDYSKDIKLRKPDATKVAQGEGVRLSEAVKRNLLTETLSPEREKLLHYVLKNASRSQSDESAYEICLRSFSKAPECVFLKPGWAENFFEDEIDLDPTETETALKTSQRNQAHKMTAQLRQRHAKVIDQVRRNFLRGTIDRVDGQVEGDIYRALKKIPKWEPEIDRLVRRLNTDPTCHDPELYVYLGMKGEEFFPDEDKMSAVLKLYSKADECSSADGANKYLQLARFRLGLLSIVQEDCVEAQKVFTRLAKMGANDYSSRAHYWSAYCARAESKKEEFLASFDELFRMNPLGYHTLSINNGDSVLVENIAQPIDPIVKPRTGFEGPYNTWIHALEDFDRMEEWAQVRKLLTPARKNPEYLLKLEPGVRLYVSTFAYRAKDTISLFRMLDSVFRTQSEYVVDSTLKLFYPLKYIDQIKGESRKINPLLIAALIRQESAFQEDIRSRVGALGLMQLMPGTARLIQKGVKRSQLLNPGVNIRIGVRYFESLVDRYNGDIELALAAYNAGAEVVDRWQRRYPTRSRLLFLDLMPYAETRNYVTLIGRNYFWYSRIYGEELKDDTGIARSGEAEFRGMKSQ